jgi:hypothetical protein
MVDFQQDVRWEYSEGPSIGSYVQVSPLDCCAHRPNQAQVDRLKLNSSPLLFSSKVSSAKKKREGTRGRRNRDTRRGSASSLGRSLLETPEVRRGEA